MSYASARSIDRLDIPVIDIGPLRDGSDPDRVAAALHRASREVGFLYVSGHGIAADRLAAARETALAFFRGAGAVKESVRISAKHRGWLAAGGAKMQDDAKPDLKESFIWGFQDSAGRTPEDHALRGANAWPLAMPALETAAMGWFEDAHAVAGHLMQGFARGLGLAPDFFTGKGGAPMSRASFVYYPPQPESAGDAQFGVGPHTDFGVLTVLAQDDVGGLQVQDLSGDWVAAPPIPDTLVINVGDLLARWTNDVYRSTPHRVVNASGQERLSLVLAYDPEPETMVDPRSVFGTGVETAHAPITCGDYLEWRFAKAFSYRK
ncbi:MAG: 2OG-Fe(II) oxygenase family protein [Pseudomonadota bacterium]